MNGESQSPINIISDISELIPYTDTRYWFVSFKYTDTLVINRNSTPEPFSYNFNLGLNFNIFSNFGTVLANQETYNARSINFHSPSEHKINNVQYPLELQIVHNSSNSTLIIVILYKESNFENLLLNEIIEGFGASTGKNMNLRNSIGGWFAIKNFYYYEGSITQPPCTEGVKYVVYSEPMSATHKQISFFSSYVNGNDRETIPQGSRPLFFFNGLRDNPNSAFVMKITIALVCLLI